jgi:CBS domain-containing protein
MSGDNIDEEERIANEQQRDQSAEVIRGSIRELSGLHDHVVALERTATVADAVGAVIENRVGAVLILEDQQLLGLFSERDTLTRVVAQGRVPSETPIVDVMTPDPECLSFDHELVFALNKMTVGGFRHVPILNKEGVPIAVVSMRDVVEHIVSFFASDVFNLPDDPDDSFTSEREGA